MRTRPATTDDLDILAELCADVQAIHAKAYPDLFKPASPSQLRPYMEWVFARDNAYIFIVEEDNVALGYVYAQYLDLVESPFKYAEKRVHIDQISVKPSYQGRGIGDLLMQAVVDLAKEKGARRVTLDSWDFNVKAHGFFKKHGFEFQRFHMSYDCD